LWCFQASQKLHAQARALKKPRKPAVRRSSSKAYREDPEWRPPPREPARRSGRQAGRPAVKYNLDGLEGDEWAEARRPRKRASLKEFVSRTEVYYQRHKDALGSTQREWVLFRDGYDEGGNRIYDPLQGQTCHQCRQKTMGKRTWCSHCESLRGVFCGDCLMMRYGEHVEEANADPDWACPSCRDLCNCSFCRTRKGYPPTGSMYRRAIREGYASVAHCLVDMYFKEGPEPAEGEELEEPLPEKEETRPAPSGCGAQSLEVNLPMTPRGAKQRKPAGNEPRSSMPPAAPQKRARRRGGASPPPTGGEAQTSKKERNVFFGEAAAKADKSPRVSGGGAIPEPRLVPPPRGRRPAGKKWDGVAGMWVSAEEPSPAPGGPRTLQEARVHVGKRVKKEFPGHGVFSGTVTDCFYRKAAPCEGDQDKIQTGFFFRVVYTDGDEEDMLWDALDSLSETSRRGRGRGGDADVLARPKVSQAFRVTRSARMTRSTAAK
jgi:hypothetical protein